MTDIFGIGPILAATLIGYSGDPVAIRHSQPLRRVHGTAPIEFSSGGRIIHRCRGGEPLAQPRPALLRIVQIRHRPQPRSPLYNRKLAEGKTRARRSGRSSHGSATSPGVASSPTPGAPPPHRQRDPAGH